MKAVVILPTIILALMPVLDKAWAEKAEPTVTIAMEGEFAPWNLKKPNGELDGFEVDLARDLCGRMKIECKFVTQIFDGMIPALNGKKFDAIMSGLQITAKREEQIAFSEPYGNTGQTFATLKTHDLTRLPDRGKVFSLTSNEAAAGAEIEKLKPLLQGRTLGVQSGSTAEAFVEQYLSGVVMVKSYQTADTHDADLRIGRIDAVLASVGYLKALEGEAGNDDIVLVGPYLQGGVLGRGVGIGFRKSDTALKAKFDDALAAAKLDGTLKRLSEKWFRFDITPR